MTALRQRFVARVARRYSSRKRESEQTCRGTRSFGWERPLRRPCRLRSGTRCRTRRLLQIVAEQRPARAAVLAGAPYRRGEQRSGRGRRRHGLYVAAANHRRSIIFRIFRIALPRRTGMLSPAMLMRILHRAPATSYLLLRCTFVDTSASRACSIDRSCLRMFGTYLPIAFFIASSTMTMAGRNFA